MRKRDKLKTNECLQIVGQVVFFCRKAGDILHPNFADANIPLSTFSEP